MNQLERGLDTHSNKSLENFKIKKKRKFKDNQRLGYLSGSVV